MRTNRATVASRLAELKYALRGHQEGCEGCRWARGARIAGGPGGREPSELVGAPGARPAGPSGSRPAARESAGCGVSPPVDQERHHAALHDDPGIRETPRQPLSLSRLTGCLSETRPSVTPCRRRLRHGFFQVPGPRRPRHQPRPRQRVDPEPPGTGRSRRLRVRPDDLQVGSRPEGHQEVARPLARMPPPSSRPNAQPAPRSASTAASSIRRRIDQMINALQQAYSHHRIIPRTRFQPRRLNRSHRK